MTSTTTPDPDETPDDVVYAEIESSGDPLLDLVHDVLARHFPDGIDDRYLSARDELVEAIHADYPLGGQFAELQTLELVVPLKSVAERRVGQDVVIWIPGGMKVDGELRSVNDDDTITIREARREFDVALQSVAVIEGPR